MGIYHMFRKMTFILLSASMLMMLASCGDLNFEPGKATMMKQAK